MKKKIVDTIKIIGFLIIGLSLFWLVYRNQDIEIIKKSILEANLWWLVLSVALGLLSHVSRALRWKLLIAPLGYNPRKLTLFYSVMIMYLTNYAIPRSGEIVRCGIISKYEKIPFSALLGTVITERAFDFLMLFILAFIVAITQFTVILDFLNNNPSAQETINNISSSSSFFVILLVSFIVFLLLFYFFRKKIKQTKLYNKFYQLFENFILGLKTVANMKQKGLFIAHTIFIWSMYFVMIVVVFKAFSFTHHLGILAGLTVFVMSSFGMVFPSPGGIGSWHFMAIETLFIYGISKVQASAFAFAAHESQMIMLIAVGLFSLIAVSFIKPFNSKSKKI
ncbi:MAG: lysylphosphatidylglycerol synthase transmembrane domain-containing protein [Bacteroidota bacterium]|nr:lysylphosphatidylglycerol synthase transmembrane domain-containing protein [Bacteroidota bacterium]